MIGAALVVGFLGAGTVQAVSALAHKTVTVHERFGTEGLRSIAIDAPGTVTVVGTSDTSSVEVVARISHGLRATTHRDRRERDRLVLHGGCPAAFSNFCAVDYRLRVPAGMPLDIDASGRVTVRDTRGGVDAHANNGSVHLVDVAGPIRAHAGNGHIEGERLRSMEVHFHDGNGSVDLDFVRAPSLVDGHAGNGTVTVRLPRGSGPYRVEARSGNGNDTRAVDTSISAHRQVHVTVGNGDIHVEYRSS